MGGAKKVSLVGMAVLVSLLFSCTSNTGYMSYREGLFQGYQCLRDEDYQAAMEQFLRASRGYPTRALPLALAGQSAYRMGDYVQAGRYLDQAEGLMMRSDYAYVIVKAYRSLIAFKEDRREEGMAALSDYVRVMGSRWSHPEKSYYVVKHMYESGNIALPRLEGLINYQVSRYERIVM